MTDTMQTTSLVELASVFSNEVVTQVNRTARLATILDKRLGKNPGGPQWPTEADGAFFEFASEGADVSSFQSDSQAGATLAWAMPRSNFHVADEAMSRARAVGNPSGNDDLWLRAMLNASDKFGSQININSFSGTSNIIGLDTALNDSNTYATIDRTQLANAYWKSNVFDPGSATSITKALVRSDIATIFATGGVRPDLAVCHPSIFAQVASAFDANRYFQNQAADGLKKNFLGDAGVTSVAIDGVLFVEDKDAFYDATDGYGSIYYLNTRHVYYEYIPYLDNYGFEYSEFQRGNQVPEAPFAMQFVPIAKTGSSSKAYIRAQLQLVVDRPNRCGVRKHVKNS